MLLEEATQLKDKMERDIQRFISEEFKKFNSATGLYPSHIDIDLMLMTTTGIKKPECIINNVTINVEL